MRILLLNFAYGMGVDGSKLSYLARAPLFFYAGRTQCIGLANLIKREYPDVVALVEIDGGSMRAGFVPQWQEAIDLGGYSSFARSKYSPLSFWQYVPILRRHMNAFLYKNGTTQAETVPLYFSVGMKRLILRQTLADDTDIYLVHLDLDYPTRATQLSELAEIISKRGTARRVIVTGDFNALWRSRGFVSFFKATGLQFGSLTPNATFPAYRPEQELDFFLTSPQIKINRYEILPEIISDHRAIMLETR